MRSPTGRMNTTMGCWSLQFASQGWNPAMPSNAASGAGTREETLGGRLLLDTIFR